MCVYVYIYIYIHTQANHVGEMVSAGEKLSELVDWVC